jgi:hypothetical protein
VKETYEGLQVKFIPKFYAVGLYHPHWVDEARANLTIGPKTFSVNWCLQCRVSPSCWSTSLLQSWCKIPDFPSSICSIGRTHDVRVWREDWVELQGSTAKSKQRWTEVSISNPQPLALKYSLCCLIRLRSLQGLLRQMRGSPPSATKQFVSCFSQNIIGLCLCHCVHP